ncbi:5-formyltetrahydrofolate cyclo-ligase [Allostreptomyces psammosilenae]|uniref:5-formyltetrahydrofolate cyclo-ligase n=1 Tax=Allostreptomyces psammosilenae TaxID=1892865 RepID=A0A853A0V9_9ACTN|nr:5-formyltetrahydrofolate cyclo-ligase [Allostreptomyces psammosilenae]NYI07777.1 5-formyltetrahydrofolate cyclo-ligase [Allostreptomyces psammosilenae]
MNDKRALRSRLLADRRRRAVGDGAADASRDAARRLARLLELPELPGDRTTPRAAPTGAAGAPDDAAPGAAPTVAAYASFGTEPDTFALLDALAARGTRVLLPVLLPDLDLDWARYEGRERLVSGDAGMVRPDGPTLGREAVLGCAAVVVPGLAVDERGVRLGRGGGSYDRVLERLAEQRRRGGRHVPVIVLLHEGEVLERVPAEPHDRPVDIAVTPSAVHRFPRPAEAEAEAPDVDAPADVQAPAAEAGPAGAAG